MIHFKTPVLSEKLQYSRKLKRYLGWDGRVFGGISTGTEEFLRGILAGTEEFLGDILAGTEQCKNRFFLMCLKNYFDNVLLTHDNTDHGGHVRAIG